MAIQRGQVRPSSAGRDSVAAWAGHWVLGYTFRNAPWQPRILGEYNYASGDANPKDGRQGTFDQLYPTAHDKYGLADQVGWKNIRHVRSGADWKPAAKWMIGAKYSGYWLADPHDGLYNTSSTLLVRNTAGTAGQFVGTELDATALWSPVKTTQIGVGLAHLFPGTFLKHASPG